MAALKVSRQRVGLDLILADVDAIVTIDDTSLEATFLLLVVVVLWSFGEVVMVHVDS